MSFGRLEQGKNSNPMSDINMTPLVDVMLVLVVILIITAPLLASSIKLDLPKSSAGKAGDAPKFVSIAVDKSGALYLNDNLINEEDLQKSLTQTAKDNPKTEVQLRADQNVIYARVVAAITAAQNAGLSRIAFVTEKPNSSASTDAPTQTRSQPASQ